MELQTFMIMHICLATTLFSAMAARAEVRAETECYISSASSTYSRGIRLMFRRYVDTDMKREVGSFVQYNDSKEMISLVVSKHVNTDTDDPELGNYEDSRAEVIGGKVTGVYSFVQTGAGVRQGKYVRYTNAKTGKSVTFQYTGDDDRSCKVNL